MLSVGVIVIVRLRVRIKFGVKVNVRVINLGVLSFRSIGQIICQKHIKLFDFVNIILRTS